MHILVVLVQFKHILSTQIGKKDYTQLSKYMIYSPMVLVRRIHLKVYL